MCGQWSMPTMHLLTLPDWTQTFNHETIFQTQYNVQVLKVGAMPGAKLVVNY